MTSETRYGLDLTERAFVHRHGDLLVIGCWVGSDRRQPCLAIVPAHRPTSHQRFYPAVVPLEMAWLWSETLGDEQHCIESCVRFAEGLNMDPTFFTCCKLLYAFRDHLGDLLSMPPAPTEQHRVVADALYVDQDGREHHQEIRDRD